MPMPQICRTCIQKNTDSEFITLKDNSESLKIRKKLSTCIPEMVIDRVTNPILCLSCASPLHSAYNLKPGCLLTEVCIQNHIPIHVNDKNCSLEETNIGIKQSNLPKLIDLSDSSNALVDDLNSLLDGALQNQQERLGVLKKNQDGVKSDHVLEIEGKVTKKEYFSLSDNEFENDFYENGQDETPSFTQNKECFVKLVRVSDELVNFLQNKECFVKLVKLSDELVNSSISNNLKESNKSVFKCTVCDYSNPHKKNVSRHHKRIHTSERPFACHLCNFRGRVKRHLKTHMKIHPQIFKCDLCNYESKREYRFKNHVVTHNVIKTKKFCCTVCDHKTVTEDSLKSHMRFHGEKTFICNVCDRSFWSKSNLTEHVLVHTGEKPFACNICQFKTSYKANLGAHMRIHTKNYFTCNICKYRTFDKKYLRQHMLIHTGEKPFVCKVCEFQTSSKERLKDHVNTHTGERPFSCKLCKLSFTHRTNLRRHRKVMHEKQKSFSCKLCEYKCKTEFHLNAHIKYHSAKNILTCSICKYITPCKKSLKAHAKVHLKDPN